MYKLLYYLLLSLFCVLLQAFQTDAELAMHTLFEAKHGVNRAAHAAAQQIDQDELALGVLSIDPAAARATALQYLQANLRLDSGNEPLPGTFLQSAVEILTFEVINGDRTFPYEYRNDQYNYSVTLRKPGVVMIVRLSFPRTYRVLGPVDWEIKSAAEVVE